MTWYGHRLIIFGFLPQISKTKAVAVGVSVQQSRGLGEQARSARMNDLAVFRCVFYDCLALRADALFELADAETHPKPSAGGVACGFVELIRRLGGIR
jgi:hypothetical protein